MVISLNVQSIQWSSSSKSSTEYFCCDLAVWVFFGSSGDIFVLFFLGRCFGLVHRKSIFTLFVLAFHLKVFFFLDHCLMIFVKVYVVVFLKVYH